MKHGLHKSATYYTWGGMIQRCTNPKYTYYAHYGGRGIKVCERWRDFRNFLADMGERPEGMTLDRIDNDSNYEPSNCRWATKKEQALNRRVTTCEINGKTKPIRDWLKVFNLNRSTFDQRFYVYKWSIEKSLTTPVGKRG